MPYSLQAPHDDIIAIESHNLILVRVTPLDVLQEAFATNEEGEGKRLLTIQICWLAALTMS